MKKVVPKRSYPKSKIGFFQQMKKSRTLLLMLMPAVVLVFIFAYIPMGGVILAFKQFRYDLGIFGSPFMCVEWGLLSAGLMEKECLIM